MAFTVTNYCSPPVTTTSLVLWQTNLVRCNGTVETMYYIIYLNTIRISECL